MAKLVTKFKYYKPFGKKKFGGYAQYLACRNGVDKSEDTKKYTPSTVGQKKLIEKILKDFPDSKDMLEFDDYISSPTNENASEFISRAIEDNYQYAATKKTYADYIATRPRAEKLGKHGLFSNDGDEIILSKVSDELNAHEGNMWTMIVSLRREDAERLNYDNATAWRELLRAHTSELSDALKIPLSKLKWYAAFHNESHHPHIHLLAYTDDPQVGFLTKQGINNMRSALGNDIFQEDLQHIFTEQTERRNALKKDWHELLEDILKKICQAYSLVGRAQSSHMETPMSEDPRNELYKLYVRFLTKYQPRMFVFENVMGIETANAGRTWKNIQSYLKRVGYEIEFHEQNSKDFGVLQSRHRMIIVGWLKDSPMGYPAFDTIEPRAKVYDLLGDLPSLHPGEKGTEYSGQKQSKYLTEFGIREKGDVLTLHESRPNKPQDIEIYKRTIELWNDGHQRMNYNDLPEELKTHKNRKSFLDRFKVVEGDEPTCHTMLAHISKDGHYFIHPDIQQHRSITVREAARIQSFPDSFFFEGPRTSQFTQIGNAVPPLMAKGIAQGIQKELDKGI